MLNWRIWSKNHPTSNVTQYVSHMVASQLRQKYRAHRICRQCMVWILNWHINDKIQPPIYWLSFLIQGAIVDLWNSLSYHSILSLNIRSLSEGCIFTALATSFNKSLRLAPWSEQVLVQFSWSILVSLTSLTNDRVTRTENPTAQSTSRFGSQALWSTDNRLSWLHSHTTQLMHVYIHTWRERLKALHLNIDSQMLGHQYKLLGASQLKVTSW